MTYSINSSGQRGAALDDLRSKATQQRTNMQSTEQQALDEHVARVTDKVNEYAGEQDSVSISISGHKSQSERSLAIGENTGISVSRYVAPAEPAPALTQAREIASGTGAPTASAPTSGTAPVTTNSAAGTAGSAGVAGTTPPRTV